jgi:hypothetical protein
MHVAASHELAGSVDPQSGGGQLDKTVQSSDRESDAQMEELFQHVQAFDANHDGYIDVAEMKLFLIAVGAWETEAVYMDDKWPRAWPGICQMMQADSTKGLPLGSFTMYHEKYRKGKLAHDLNQLSFGISNPAAREWWRTYIGERRSVRVQLAVDAFVVWMEKQGLPPPLVIWAPDCFWCPKACSRHVISTRNIIFSWAPDHILSPTESNAQACPSPRHKSSARCRPQGVGPPETVSGRPRNNLSANPRYKHLGPLIRYVWSFRLDRVSGPSSHWKPPIFCGKEVQKTLNAL